VIRRVTVAVGVAASVVALDQWTKRWASDFLAYRAPIDVIGELVRFTYTRNSGVAFGLGAGHRFPFYLFSIAAVCVILFMFSRHRTHTIARQLALALILGGALGNLVDRLSTGEVVDFILVGWRRWYWPVFNVADSAVSVGVALFALTWLRQTEPPSQAEAAPDDPPVAIPGPGDEPRGAARPLPGHGADGPVA